ncbi:MAG: hypothetical protein RSD71_17075 [Flavobacterium sp.]
MKNITILTTFLFLFLTVSSYGQINQKKDYFPGWTFHKDSINIHGISIGLWSFNDEPRYTNTNGVKFELIGVGIALPLIPRSPIVETEEDFLKLNQKPLSERINGLSLSTSGTVCHCVTNGFTAGFIGQINFKVNGISTSLVMNLVQKQNGFMASMFNDAYSVNGLQIGLGNTGVKARGVQIGLINNSKNLKGIQIGLWNVNQKRKLPLINWNFRHD